jgi:hypothetical protein
MNDFLLTPNKNVPPGPKALTANKTTSTHQTISTQPVATIQATPTRQPKQTIPEILQTSHAHLY